MAARLFGGILLFVTVCGPAVVAQSAHAQNLLSLVLPEQRTIQVRDPSELAPAPMPLTPPPPTVAEWNTEREPILLSLDEAIRIALANSTVVRVLTGVAAASTGSTIYDTAITNAGIDRQRGLFDPRIQVQNGFNRTESPSAQFDPLDPFLASLHGLRTDDYQLAVGIAKPTVTGGTFGLGVNARPQHYDSDQFPLNPQSRSSVQMDFTQPLLQGGGIAANVAPIVLARIDTERSFFQFKDSVQTLVIGVIQGYWALVAARTDVWAREQQVQQLQQAYDLAEAKFRLKLENKQEVSQTKVSLANFTAARIAARGVMLQRETALRTLLRLPPADGAEIIPTTPPLKERMEIQWEPLLELAAERRPEIIELKLILEADEQQLLLAQNQALPQLDAVALYRWNGLEGETPTGNMISTRPGEFTDWTLGVNFSVPLGLRTERAALRQRELILARDRANIEQGVLLATQQLALSLQNTVQFYEQYQAYTASRTAARENVLLQWAVFRANRQIFLNVLLAITDWGNAVSAEAQSLLQYNTELARLEQQTGTILETHGVRFYEERFESIGPLGRCGPSRSYPAGLPPTPNVDRYSSGDVPAENSFNLEDPIRRIPRPEPIERPEPVEPAPGAEGGP
jgi:outer membrane protein TolC